MHPSSRLPGPVYITRLLNIDANLARTFPGVNAYLLPGNLIVQNRALADDVREKARVLIIDPLTHHFTYHGYLEKQTYVQLPYAPQRPILANRLLADPPLLRQFVDAVLGFQIQHWADLLIAPYFYVRDLDDARLTANLRMVAESESARARIAPQLPLYMVVCLGSLILKSPPQVDEVARLFLDLPVRGYFVLVENLDDRTAGEDDLMGLARLMNRLQEGHDAFTCSIASYGQVLTALGANGFSAGVGWLETFREVTLQPGREGFAAERAPRAQYYYIPELLSYVHPDQLSIIYDEQSGSETMRTHYRCECEVCAAGLPDCPPEKKRHFMIRRQQEMDEMARWSPQERAERMRSRIELALELAAAIEEEALVRIPTEHFVRWIAVIDAMRISRAAATEGISSTELNDIIHQSRRRPND